MMSSAEMERVTGPTTFSGQPTGPYIATTPTNPVNGHTDVLTVTTDQTGGTAIAGGTNGFVYNTTNGKMWATNTAGDHIFNETDPSDPNN